MLSEVEIHLAGGCPAFVIHECLLHGKVEDCVLGHIGTIAQAQVQHVGNGSGRTGGRELTDAPSHVPAIITLPVAVTPPVTLPVAVIEPTLIVTSIACIYTACCYGICLDFTGSYGISINRRRIYIGSIYI